MRITSGNGHTVAEYRFEKILGRSALGSYMVTVAFNVQRHSIKGVASIRNTALRLDANVDGQVKTIAWGHPESRTSVELSEHAGNQKEYFSIQLSNAQLCALEKYRSGGDISFSLWLHSDYCDGMRVASTSDHEHITVTRQDWLDALKAMGFTNKLLFEVATLSPTKEDRSDIQRLIELAYQHLLSGSYSEAVTDCRKAIEALESNPSEKKVADSATDKFKSDRQNMTVAERVAFLRVALKNVTHLGPHYSSGEVFDHRQARIVVAATIALIADLSVDMHS